MYKGKMLKTLIGCALVGASLSVQAQLTPGTVLGLSRDVGGSVTNIEVSPGGCANLVCTTNMTTSVHCFTNCYWRLVCTTNSSGQLQCTNVLVCNPKCYTNTYPEITCTNVFSTPTSVHVRQQLTGAIAGNAACDELTGMFSSNAVIMANLSATLRTNDWRGSHIGTFKIVDGTNIVAYGSMSGVNGVGSHRGLEPCAICNHIEGVLLGSIVQSGALRGARITASYKGDLSGTTCPSATVPQGPISLSLDGTVVIPCPRLLWHQ